MPFVVWFNFLAGFAYVAAGVGLWRFRLWTARLALAIAVATALVFVALGAQIAAGSAFEARTVAAMTLRTVIWAAIAVLTWRSLVSGPARNARQRSEWFANSAAARRTTGPP